MDDHEDGDDDDMMIHLTFKRITFNKSILGTHKTNKLKGEF